MIYAIRMWWLRWRLNNCVSMIPMSYRADPEAAQQLCREAYEITKRLNTLRLRAQQSADRRRRRAGAGRVRARGTGK
jgi:hypothetical protein